MIQYHPESEAGGATTESAPAEKTQEAPEAPASEAPGDFRSLPLDGEDVPAKLRGKTGADLLKSYQNLERRLGQISQKQKEAEQSAAEPAVEEGGPQPGFLPEGYLAQLLSGTADEKGIEDAANRLGVAPKDAALLARLVEQHKANTVIRAQQALSEELGTDVDVPAMIEAARKSELFSDQHFAFFDEFMSEFESIEPLRIIARRLQEAGVDVTDLNARPASEPNRRRSLGLPNLEKGSLAPTGEMKGFESRGDYLAALGAAQGDKQKLGEVDARLKKSRIDRWPDRHISA
jgi:hypothetical protein